MKEKKSSIELFSGAGGLALGLEQSGWHHRALIERDENACSTIRLNELTRVPWAQRKINCHPLLGEKQREHLLS